jgi:2-amino-4-hydroxy-6-hydroxymethyldihydropteridine diphosphokinase
MARVYVGAGSNSEPAEHLRAAVAALERVFGAVRCSSVFRSAAVGAPAPDYLNLVAAFESERPASELKSELVGIERALGRRRDDALAARRAVLCAIDLDLLMVGARVDGALHLPHPDVLRRAFVLAPLAELAPDLRHPVSGERLASAWARRGAASAIDRVGGLAEIAERPA